MIKDRIEINDSIEITKDPECWTVREQIKAKKGRKNSKGGTREQCKYFGKLEQAAEYILDKMTTGSTLEELVAAIDSAKKDIIGAIREFGIEKEKQEKKRKIHRNEKKN